MLPSVIDVTGTTVDIRRSAADDEPFRFELYVDHRRAEFENLGWPEPERGRLLAMQFEAQQRSHTASYANADDWTVFVKGERVGRLLVARTPGVHLVVDVLILRAWRGRGIGTALMREITAAARTAGAELRLTADSANARLIAWYGRLGFTVRDATALHSALVLCP